MPDLSGIHVFKDLPPHALTRLAAGAQTLEASHGEELFEQDEAGNSVYAITGGAGHVRIGAMDRRSKKLMVEIFGPGDLFGEIGAIDGGPRTATAVVDGQIRLARIGADTFNAVLADTPQLGANLSRLLAGRLRRTFSLFQDATFETVEVRLARQVIYLATHGARRTDAGMVLGMRLKQADLADLLGTTTRSIITVLNAWRTANIVRYDANRAQLTICDEKALRDAFEG